MVEAFTTVIIVMLMLCVIFLIIPIAATIFGWGMLLFYVGRDIGIWLIRRYYQWKHSRQE